MNTFLKKLKIALLLLNFFGIYHSAYPCVASSSLVNVPEGKITIDRLLMGDQVMTYSPNEQLTEFRSEPESVKDVSGTPAEANRVLINLQMTTNQSLLATTDQVLVTVDGKMIRASTLMVGDKIWGCNGESLQLASVVTGRFNVGVFGLTTDFDERLSLDNHFICVNGVIAGDFYIQINYNDLVDNEQSDHAYYSEYRR